MLPYERFKAWQLSHALALQVYHVTKTYPAAERFLLVSQSRRAAFSAPANIVEGSSKRGKKEFRRFLDISAASLVELGYWLRVARDLEMLSDTDWARLERQRAEASKVTWGLYAAVTNAIGRAA